MMLRDNHRVGQTSLSVKFEEQHHRQTGVSVLLCIFMLFLFIGCAPTTPGTSGGSGASSILPWSSSNLKIGYIRSDVISQKYADYRDADNALRNDNRKWLEETEQMEKEISRKEEELEELKLILSPERKKELEEALLNDKKALQKFRHETWYDEDSQYIKRRRELIEPVDARVNDAIWIVAEAERFDLIFDTIAGNIVYVKPEYDLTDKVLEELQE
ncbi:MAG: OmpH family outer membrane protein [Candidatus Hatepunaea meridiana]|nr:OmpH family outer membrane protein [Candidatus Hatepunaea meridiana]